MTRTPTPPPDWLPVLRERLAAVIAEKRLTGDDFADCADARGQKLSRTYTNDIKTGRIQRPAMDKLDLIAKIIGDISVEWLIGKTDIRNSGQAEPVHVKAAAEAGVWRDRPDWPREGWTQVPNPQDQRFKGLARFGVALRDDSMAGLLPRDAVLYCIECLDLPRQVRPGELVIVRRHKPDGTVETTCRRVEGDGGGQWLATVPATGRPDRTAHPPGDPRAIPANSQPGETPRRLGDPRIRTEIYALVVSSWAPMFTAD